MSSRGGHGSGVPEWTQAGLYVFLSDPYQDPESKICEKADLDPESLFSFGSCRSLFDHILRKTWVNSRLRRRKPESEQETDSQILKFPGPDPDSKILKQERIRNPKN